MTTKDELLDILHDLNADADFEKCEDLVEEGFLTSLEMVMLISEISSRMGVQLPPEEIVPENFRSVESIRALIEKARED